MAKRNAPKLSNQFTGIFLIICGIFLVSVSTLRNSMRMRSLRLDQETIEAFVNQEQVKEEDLTRHYPAHIFIQWYVDVDIEPALHENGRWTISEDKASYLVNSGQVDNGGNIIIYGHNTRAILGNIRALNGYEDIVLTTKDGRIKTYQIVSQKEVNPQDVSLLQPTVEEVMTIYTCSGFMDSQRYVIRAVPKILQDQAVSF